MTKIRSPMKIKQNEKIRERREATTDIRSKLFNISRIGYYFVTKGRY